MPDRPAASVCGIYGPPDELLTPTKPFYPVAHHAAAQPIEFVSESHSQICAACIRSKALNPAETLAQVLKEAGPNGAYQDHIIDQLARRGVKTWDEPRIAKVDKFLKQLRKAQFVVKRK